MGKTSKIFGVIFNVLSFVCLFASAIPSTQTAGGPGQSFAFWGYSVIFALVGLLLYTIGAFKALKSGGGFGKLLFTIAVFALCITVGGALDSTAIVIWKVINALNLIFQIRWIINS